MHSGSQHWIKNGWGIIPFLLLSIVSIDCAPSLYADANFNSPPFLKNSSQWADSVLSKMTQEEKIGQLFMVAAYSNKDKSHTDELNALIRDYKIGGMIFFQGGPLRQAKMTNEFQATSKVPLWIGMDAEWGLGMRLDSTISYPREMTLGAVNDPRIVYEYGKEMARQLKRMGVHVSFSPVVDINSNPKNPVIGNRSFGESRERVAELGLAYMRGLQDQRVLACAKHFPGHGDTDKDSHLELPSVKHDYARLDSVELYPFKRLIEEGVGSVMIAHLFVPALDSTVGRASTLSQEIVQDLLRDSLNFKGLTFTDALNMKGVSSYFKPGELDLKALLAGNDVLLFPEDVPSAVAAIQQAIKDSVLSEQELDRHCLRILRAKSWVGLDKLKPIKLANLYQDLNNNQAEAIQKKVIAASLTVLQNRAELLPINLDAQDSVAVLHIGSDGESFNATLSKYFGFDQFSTSHDMNFAALQSMSAQLSQYKTVIVNVYGTSQRPTRKYGISEQSSKLIRDVAEKTKVITVVYANAYSLKYMDGVGASQALIMAYQNDDATQVCVAEALCGAGEALGTMPVTVNAKYAFGMGEALSERTRLRDSSPESTGISSESLAKIDSIAKKGIAAQAYPGCQILVAKDGNIIYNKSFGHYTYEEKEAVTSSSIYDLASITKVVASTASMMKLNDEAQVDINHNLCDYLDICDTSSYFQINLMEMMSHTARLRAWIPFYVETLKNGNLNQSIYSTSPKTGFCTQVAEGLYICDDYEEKLKSTILESSLRNKREYKYSDLGYYFIKDIIEKKSGLALENYVDSTFYKPLGLKTMGFLPLNKHSMEEIVPTEYDMTYRKQLIRGHVHDPGAAMMGGVGGHAGVFSNSYDLAVMMQLFMNGGSYGGVEFIQPETVDYFSSCHFCDEDNRRGIGFDKPTRDLNSGPTCNGASASSFGHSGFTGTITWADPEHGIVYVFLSNRVYPDANNNKLLKMDIRTDIQDVVYKAYGIPARTIAGTSSVTEQK